MDTHEAQLLKLLKDDHSAQVHDWYFAERLFDVIGKPKHTVEILDLGAGDGASKAHFARTFGTLPFTWTGVDIADSDEILARPASAPKIDYYDGTNLPYANAQFDVCWSRQVLEHVRYPDKVVAEVARVLKPGGYFIGSVSQLEPYHSRSIFNWTHYGVITVFRDHGLEVTEMRAGVDSVTLLIRSLFGRRSNLNRFFRVESPVNVLLQNMFVDDGSRSHNVKTTQLYKLRACGHIHFVAKRK